MTNRFLPYFDPKKTPRDVQVQILDWLHSVWDNGKPKILSAPVATGKSDIALAIARYNKEHNKYTAINTCTNILVDQYANDFPEENTLKGSAQYSCCTLEGFNCEERRLVQKGAGRQISDLDCRDVCPYIKARRNVFLKKVTFFNPLSYIFMNKKVFNSDHTKCLGDSTPDTIIVDEFHNLPSMLRGQFETVLWQDDVDWKAGTCGNLMSVVEVFERRMQIVKEMLSGSLPQKKRLVLDREMTRLRDVCKAVEKYPQLFVAEEKIDKKYGKSMRQLSLRPVYVPENFSQKFFAKKYSAIDHEHTPINNVVLMSGTAFEHHYKELSLLDVDYFDCPSCIDKERRQIIVRPAIRNSMKVDQKLVIRTLAKEILQIVDKHKGESGIVLATYKQAEELRQVLTSDEFLFHDKDDKADVIKQFVQSGSTRKVAVLAGSWEGLDLKDDISRFTIITKLPFANLGDKVVQRRKELDETLGKGLWYSLEAMQFVMQGSGRSTRGPNDFSTTYVLDSNFARVYAQTRSNLPKWFQEAVVFQQ